jgi:hypothetical protein
MSRHVSYTVYILPCQYRVGCFTYLVLEVHDKRITNREETTIKPL